MTLWSILIATQARRQDKLARLLDVLLPQAEQARGLVEVVALRNNCELRIHDYRQALLDDARGEYVSFVDDDDLVSEDFVPAVLAEMQACPGVDFVAFRHAYYQSGVFVRETRTGLNIGTWCDLPEYYVRPVTHMNPVRAELARKAGFLSEEMFEDRPYDEKIQALAKTEAVIDRVLYHYFHDWRDSVIFGNNRKLLTVPRRPSLPSPVFRWHPLSI